MRSAPTHLVLSCLALCLAPAGAHAQVAPPVLAEIEASSAVANAYRALDADTHSAWCRAASDDATGGALTIRFAEPVQVRSIAIYGVDAADDLAPIVVTITSDGGTVETALDADTRAAAEVTSLAGTTRSLAFRLPPTGPGPRVRHGACLSEIDVRLVDRTWVYGVSAAAASALPAAIDAIEDALRSCDPRELATIARFPVRFRDTDPASPRAYAHEGTSAFPHGFRQPRELPCAWGVFSQDDRPRQMPSIDGGIALGVVRVLGGAAITDVYWELGWSASGWRLIAIDSAFFE